MKEDLIKQLADKLIETLGNMSAEEADATVKYVATALYNDVLGIPGYVKIGKSATLCTKNNGCISILSCRFEPLEKLS